MLDILPWLIFMNRLQHFPSGLAKQVSMLLTHHLARATDGIGHAMADTEALQEVNKTIDNITSFVQL